MKVFLKWVFALIMMIAGINHFINPAFYQGFIPPLDAASFGKLHHRRNRICNWPRIIIAEIQ